MKIVQNSIIPFKGYLAINICGVLFTRNKDKINARVLTHERIHTLQIKEMGYIFFYLWYVIEWFIRLFMKGNAYHNISFEREAYSNQYNPYYLCSGERKPYAWIHYIRNPK